MNKEIRNINLQDINVETTEDECILKGYVNKYNTRSQNLGGFYEEIRQGAFDDSLTKNNILALYGHDYNKPLGRLGNNLELKSDDIGLYFELRINPKVSWAKDTYELVKDGVLNGMSFGFCCEDDEWIDDNGKCVRNINKLDLFEISVVSSPAYVDSTVSCRNYEQHKQNELTKRKLKLELELI
ncbi:HK97 family phage prohead protease [Clostridium tetani]|uniref:HK97 family phage prohead protease n=1 Tax=Clostridium tetani TaxID=1513 RepID=UPI0005133871|nr:HK97 family phage prohead protease [Clostridium tetani]KGI43894.1 hypothetical protein KY55_05630 [Clostridium tetani]RXI68181.1 HK97 family phage prohead protease [Clostridium tetani]BDR75765.1 peptidase [Clostridium tetani]BDR86881.1 peptidase [Clostridium tetani]